MRKMMKLLFCLIMTIILCGSYALAESGVTIISAPEAVDLYVTYENVFVSGTVRYKLDDGVVVRKHSITQYRDVTEPGMIVTDEGNGQYRADFQMGYSKLGGELYGLGDVLPCTFSVETNKGTENVEFVLRLHEETWDPSRLTIHNPVDSDVVLGDELRVGKPMLDSKPLPDTWINIHEYSTDTLELVDETDTEYVYRVINVGEVWTTYEIREINSNRSLGTFVVDRMALASNDDEYLHLWGENSLKIPLSDGKYSGSVTANLVGERLVKENWNSIDLSKVQCNVKLADHDEIEAVSYRLVEATSQIGIRFELNNVKASGSTELLVDIEYDGAQGQCTIPITVVDDTTLDASAFEFPRIWYYGDYIEFIVDEGKLNSDDFGIYCPAFVPGERKVGKCAGVYPVTAYSGGKEIDLGTVTVMEKGGDTPTNTLIFYDDMWLSTDGYVYCSTISNVVEFEGGIGGNCPSGADIHNPKVEFSIVSVSEGCPYEIELIPSNVMAMDEYPGDLGDNFLIRMTPKVMPLTTGQYSFVVEAKISCCGQTAQLKNTCPVLIVDVPGNYKDYLINPPSVMRVGDNWRWSRATASPLSKYGYVSLTFSDNVESGWAAWAATSQDFRMLKEGTATWEYAVEYANGRLTLQKGTTTILGENDDTLLWFDIISALDKTGTFSGGGITATLEDGKAVISGGTIQDVDIASWMPKKITSVEIDDTILTGEYITVSITDDRAIEFILNDGVNNETEEGIKAKVSSGGKVEFVSYTDAERMNLSVSADSEMSVFNYGTINGLLDGVCEGKLNVSNYGKVLKAINVNTNQNGIFSATNAGETKSIQMYSNGNSTASINNSGNVTGIFIVCTEDNGVINAVNTGTIAGLVTEALHQGRTTLTNNGTITNESGLNIDKNAYVRVDETGRVVIDGSGIIQPGAILLDYLTDARIEETPAETIQVHITLDGTYGSIADVRRDAILIFRSAVSLTLSGIKAHAGKDQIIAIAYYTDSNGKQQRCLIRQEELYEEETGTVITGGNDVIDNLSPVKVPTLVLPDSSMLDTPVFLKYRELEIGENKIVYDLRLVDQNGNDVKMPEGSVVIFPYPEDITIKNAMEYLFTIVHHALKDTEIFSTIENTIALKEAGLCITVNSFSPFEITWEEQPEVALPQTGDNSHIILWLALLALTGTAILTLKRKTV